MGLVGTLTADNKYNSYCEEIKGAYFKIERVFIDTDRDKIVISVRGWLSEFARHNQGIGIFKRNFYIPFDYFKNVKCDRNDLIKRAYSYIVKLPEFKKFRNSMKRYSGQVIITKDQVNQEKKELKELISELQG